MPRVLRSVTALAVTLTVTFRGCDSFGLCQTDTVTVTIRPAGPNLPPTVAITNPPNGAVLWVNGSDPTGIYHQLTLGSTSSDPEGGPLTLVKQIC